MITPKEKNKVDIHCRLASRTRAAHQSLHHHPIISQLLSPSLSIDSYQIIISAYYYFFSSVEEQRKRHMCWQEFSLQSHINDLSQDLHHNAKEQKKSPLIELDWMKCQVSILGTLYVLHGSGFGSGIIAKKLRISLPSYPHYFFSRSVNEINWESLLGSLSVAVNSDEDFERLVFSANSTFQTLGCIVTS